MVLHKKLERNLQFHAIHGGCFKTFATWLAEEVGIQDECFAHKYYSDVKAWQADMFAHNVNPGAHPSYFPYLTLKDNRLVPHAWNYKTLIAHLERVISPLMDYLEQDYKHRDLMKAASAVSFPMMGYNSMDWFKQVTPDQNDPDYWLYLCIDHNVRTAKKTGCKFVWNVTNAKTKEVMFQRFTNTTSCSDWLPWLEAIAKTPFCLNRIKIVFMDNCSGNADKADSVIGRVKAATGCSHVLQDVFHVSNSLISRANNRLVCTWPIYAMSASDFC